MAESLTFSRAPSGRFIGLIGLLIAADLLIWGLSPGLGFVALTFCIALATQVLWGRWFWQAWVILAISLIPAITVMQFTSFAFALVGLAAFCAIQVCGGWHDMGRVVLATLRMPVWGNAQTAIDISDGLQLRHNVGKSALRGLNGLRDWAVPAGLGLVFILLFAEANPVIDGWLSNLIPQHGPVMPDVARILFWMIIAALVWPMLRLSVLSDRLLRPVSFRPMRQSGMLTEGSVLRSLVTFNAIFAVQTLLDLAYLSGGVSLPEGIGYAEYAHRGAYPLVVTALLAGGFALIAQPWLTGRPVLRWLLLAWVAQNVVLVISSILRLDLYVDVYGLTRLRVAAFIWMGLVAVGLGLMIWQIWKDIAVGWLIGWSATLAMAALYAVSLVNVDGVVARHNLTQPHIIFDAWYICQLSEGALPAIRTHEVETGARFCPSREPQIATPRDWREWGYRNARLRHKLSEIEGLNT